VGQKPAPDLAHPARRKYHWEVFRQRLNFEFATRKQTNPRYSLRAFAVFLEIDHSTLSKVMNGVRRATVTQIRGMGKKLGMPPEEITVHLAAEHVPDASTAQRQERLRHWTAEALAVVGGRAHWEILQLCRKPGFRADCRWIAAQAGVSVDEVNLALTRLLRLGLLDGRWRPQTGLPALTEREFRRLALARVRKKAAEDRIELANTKG
jgi:transcriptional regulator with XRE-family HTH domain